MSLFIPGMHQEVHAKVIDFDPVTQKGHVQFIGLYGRKADGAPDKIAVESAPNYLAGGNDAPYSVKRKLEYLEPKAVYLPDEWVIVIGVPKGPAGPENPKDLWAGIPTKPYQQAYYIIGALKQPPAPEHLDHDAAITASGAAKSFPAIEYTPLPHEDPKSTTT